MKNKDIEQLSREQLAQKFNEALKTEDTEQVAQAMAEMAAGIEEEILQRAKDVAAVEQLDAQAMAARGLRQLTSEEKKYYEAVIGAMKSENPKQALTSIDVTMPKTIIEDVYDSLKMEHPLLAKIDFKNTSYITEWIMNKNGKQKAIWGDITAEITKELEGSFEKLDMLMYSLTAFLPVAKSMLDLGATWLDSYVREVLKDAIYVGLEEGIVCGTGVKMPIGMNRDIEAAHGDGESYVKKTAIKVTKFTPETYGGLVGKLAVTRNGRPRTVASLIMLVSPEDYWKKVMPATTVQRPDGTFANNVLPYPTEIIQTEALTKGEAILGIAEQYFAGIGTGKEGTIEYDDSVRFLKRERVYAAFLYGNGRPKDNNAFLLLDINELQPAEYTVVTGTDTVEVEKTTWTEEELNAMTVEKIKGLAAYKGYAITKTAKAEVIAEFLAAQTAATA